MNKPRIAGRDGHVAVIGAWHLGAVAAAVNARWGRQVKVFDRDPEIRTGLEAQRPAIAEPGLADELHEHASSIRVASTPAEAIEGCGTVLVAYDTPVGDDGRLDTSPIFEAVQQAAEHAPSEALLLVHSQVPIGTGAEIERRLDELGRADILFAETPENLRLGTALENFASPGFLTVGCSSGDAAERSRSFWGDTGAEIATCDTATAELSKHVINSTLATAVALGNEIAQAALHAGADGTLAARLAKRDPRIARLPLMPGLPFGGGNLGRDLRVLADLLGDRSLPAAVERSNNDRLEVLANRIHAESPRSSITLLGLTYKPGTSTLRFSMPLALAGRLVRLGHRVRAFDPQIDLADPELRSEPGVEVMRSADTALEGAEVVVICLALPPFRELELRHLAESGVTTVFDLAGAFPHGSRKAPPRIVGP